ncbi:hypothetical protein P5673_025433 [Acropora cervicornis]|uniref:Uncharacterized protein n=2 Tax=Acropora TaxID=6127 RepID=A0AAD9UXI6_ACRCE|nr:hypothetical protein P5673_025433 [Acropora cervicornis]
MLKTMATASALVGCLFVLFTGRSMAVPIRCQTPRAGSTANDVKTWIWTKSMQLSRVTGETMSDFAQARLGDPHYDEFVHNIPGLPRYSWHLDSIQEPTLLKQIIEELFAFVDFFEEMKRYEIVNGSSFVQKFDDLINDINNFRAEFQVLEMCLGYSVTNRMTTLQPTPSPTLTKKGHDEWELGVQQEFLHWLIPVQVEFHRQTRV